MYCFKENLTKDEIAANKKFINEDVDSFMCLACLAEYLESSEDDLRELIERFKREGCALFE